jgi:uncharacterized phage protein (TIGR02218 family)
VTRTLGGPLAAHLATTTHTRAVMLRLDLVDGTSMGFTDHDRVLAFDLGDGAIDYRPQTGILPSNVELTEGFSADNLDVSGPIGDDVTLAQVRGGRFDDAVARLFFVNWASLGSGAGKWLKGRVTLANVEGDRFRFTVQGDTSRLGQRIGRTLTPYCDADFGDARCGFAVPVVGATVSAVSGADSFTVTPDTGFADDFYNFGTVTFTSGALAGIRPIEIFDSAASGVLNLWTFAPEPPQIGDTLDLRPGCEKTRVACMAYANIVNFRGFPEVPGTDQVLKYPVPAT